MNILLIFFLIAIGLSLHPVRHEKFNSAYLSVENTTALRGILAITIVLHHISEKISVAVLFQQLVHTGYMIVALFFFLSGYGIIVQYKKKGDAYLKGFWKKRILYLFLIFILVTLVYYPFHCWRGKEMGLAAIKDFFINGHPIATNSWYIVVQIALYIILWISFQFSRNLTKVFWLVLGFTTLLNIGLYASQYGSIWYISNYAFPLGILWAVKEQDWIEHIYSHYWFYFIGNLIVFGVSSAFHGTIARMISSCAITSFCIIGLMKVNVCGNIWKHLGEISLDIYLLHALAYMFLRSEAIYITNDVLWTIATLVLTYILAIVGHFVSSHISLLLKK